MKYRMLSYSGDYTFGTGGGNFYSNTPEAVAQAVLTRLKLIQGEWFLDTTAGTPYHSEILGMGKVATYDAAIQSTILNTQGVQRITDYASAVNTATREAVVSAYIDTIYGATQIVTTL